MRAGVIYKYTSPSGKIYIGQTVNEKRRYSLHKNRSKNPDSYFHLAIAKYGIENFTYEVVFKSASKNEEKLKFLLDIMEQYFIKKYKSNDRTKGYNLTAGGEGLYSPSLETRIKISQANKGRIIECKLREQISNTLKSKYASGEITVKNKRSIEVYLKEALISVYDSITEAANDLNICSTSISNILSGRAKKTRLGYIFKYRKEV